MEKTLSLVSETLADALRKLGATTEDDFTIDDQSELICSLVPYGSQVCANTMIEAREIDEEVSAGVDRFVEFLERSATEDDDQEAAAILSYMGYAADMDVDSYIDNLNEAAVNGDEYAAAALYQMGIHIDPTKVMVDEEEAEATE